MPVPNQFANVTTSIPLSQLDANFNTPITLGNTAIQLGNTVTTLNNMTLANVTISSGNVTITNVAVTTANVTTANIATANIATQIVTTSQTLNYGTANAVVYLNGSKVSTTGTALQFDGTNLGLGVTPSAWNAVTPALQLGGAGSFVAGQGASTDAIYVGTNAHYDGSNWKYKLAGPKEASYYVQNVGTHQWFTAAAGTAGNNITFTQLMNLNTNGALALRGGSLVATGVGITFPNTVNPSSDINTLDDYEEGDWTPALGGTTTYLGRYGRFTKIGNVVTCQFSIRINAIGTGSTNQLQGLPFASANLADVQSGGCSYFEALAVNTSWLSCYVENNATTVQFVGQNAFDGTCTNAIGLFGNGTIVYGTFTYRTA